MAVSHSHKLGQIIGESLENAIEPFLREFANENHLYFDKKGRRVARPGTKLTWVDINQNKHDLDFVIERGGTDNMIGTPFAFIECAWRRYTKHSRNKVQEIQGAIMPLFEKYKKASPFIGVILAGEFTENSLKQLRSLGFCILYFSYEKIVNAFATTGIDVYFDESTSEIHFARQIELWKALPETQKEKVYGKITEQNPDEIGLFVSSLRMKINRRVFRICLWLMFGRQYVFDTAEGAKEFILDADLEGVSPEFCQYEAEIEYSNGDMIKVSYHNQSDILNFLSNFV